MITIIGAALLMVNTQCIADWTHENDSFLGWVATNGDITLRFTTEKGAKKAVKALNKNDKKLERKTGGVWDDGSDYCANPLNEC